MIDTSRSLQAGAIARHSRRRVVSGLGAALATGVLPAASAAQSATPVATVNGGPPLPPAVTAIMGRPLYAPFTQWGIHVADHASGEAIYALNAEQRYVPGSTTKLFPAAAALAAYGPDYRFQTPVYTRGTLHEGVLDGELVLVASGDITMGGRDLPDGTLAYGTVDHTDANAAPGFGTYVETDPLAGLNALAEQVAAAGITQANDVIIDARLWPQTPKDSYVLSPIMINDNVLDLITTPGQPGEPATLTWRPETAAFTVRTEAVTVGSDEPLQLGVEASADGEIVVQGQIPAGSEPILLVSEVQDPPAFARTLFIEALQRQGVRVLADPTGPNPPQEQALAPDETFAPDNQVALLTSLPFSEVIKVILKVSLNTGADTLVFLLALKAGGNTFQDGLIAIRTFLSGLGVDPGDISLGDGRGNDRSDLFSPRAVCDLLRAMAAQPEFPDYAAALPILGVDGTEWTALPATSPALGQITGKSGTTIAYDLMNEEFLALGKATAGYMTASSGRELVWAVYVNDVLGPLNDLLAIGEDIGEIAEAIWKSQ